MLAIALTGCASIPPPLSERLGPPPPDIRTQCDTLLRQELRNYQTAHITWLGVRQVQWRDGLVMGGALHRAWCQEVEINAQNGFGGFTGNHIRYIALEPSGVLTDVTDSVEANAAVVY